MADEIDKKKELVELERQKTAELQKQLDLKKQDLATQAEINPKVAKNADYIKLQSELQKAILNNDTASFEQLKEDLAKRIEKNNELKKAADFMTDALDLELQIAESKRKTEEAEAGVADETERASKAQEAFNEAAAQAQDIVQGVADRVGGLATRLSGISQLGALSTGPSGMAAVFTEAALGIQATNVELARQTGFASKLNPAVEKLVAEGGDLGLSFSDGARIVGDLNSSFRDLAAQSPDTIASLARTVSELETLGASAHDQGAALDVLTRSMGMTTGAASEALVGFKDLAQDVGLPTGQVLKDFNAISPRLAKFGSSADREFRKLTKQARELGISVEDAFAFGEKLDTFEGAADLAGKLNAQFRLQLNSTELLAATEADRLKIIRDQFRAKQGDRELGRFERKALAEMLGMTEDQAVRIMGNATAFAEYSEKVAENEDRQAKFVEVQKVLASSFERAVISFTPFLKMLMGLVEVIAKIASSPLVAWTLMTTAALVGLGRAIGAGLTALKFFRAEGAKNIIMLKLKEFFGFKAAAASTAEAGADTAAAGAENLKTQATGRGAAVQKVANSVAAAGVGPMLALGGAILMIGVGIGAAAFGMSYLVESFAGLSGPQMVGAIASIAVLTAGFYLMIPAVATAGATSALAVGPLLALGGAILMMGAGVGLAAYGFSLLVNSFKGLSGDQAAAAAASIVAVSVSIGALAVAMAFGGSGAVAGIIGLGVGMAILAVSLKYATPLFMSFVKGFSLIESDKILNIAMSIGVLAASIGVLTFGLGVMFAALANPIAGIAGLIAIGTLAAMLFTLGEAAEGVANAAGGIEPLEKLVTVTTQATPAQLENLSQVIDQIVRVSSETTAQGVAATSNLAQAVFGATTPAGSGGGSMKTVVLQVNRDVLGKVVADFLQDEYGVEIR